MRWLTGSSFCQATSYKTVHGRRACADTPLLACVSAYVFECFLLPIVHQLRLDFPHIYKQRLFGMGIRHSVVCYTPNITPRLDVITVQICFNVTGVPRLTALPTLAKFRLVELF